MSIGWWLVALRLYHETGNQFFIRLSVEQIIMNISHEEWYSDMQDDFDLKKAIKEIEELVPDILREEKKKIVKAFGERVSSK